MIKIWTINYVHVALQIAPAMFVADWAFNNALRHTSVASATVIVSSQNVVVFLLAVLTKIEGFCWIKLGGVLISMIGIALTAVHDTSDENMGEQLSTNAIVGDVFALVAAISYGIYTVQVRLFCPQNEGRLLYYFLSADCRRNILSLISSDTLLFSQRFVQDAVIDGIHRSRCYVTMPSICSVYDIQCSTPIHLDYFWMHCRQGTPGFCIDGLLLIPVRRVN